MLFYGYELKYDAQGVFNNISLSYRQQIVLKRIVFSFFAKLRKAEIDSSNNPDFCVKTIDVLLTTLIEVLADDLEL